MESRAEQAIASPTWGGGKTRSKPAQARRGVRLLDVEGTIARDVGGAALLLGATAALWAAFLVAVW